MTISEGGVLPYANTFAYDSWFAQKVSQFVPIRVPIKELTSDQKHILLHGSPSSFEGLIPNLERRYRQTQSDFIRAEIEKYMRKEVCPSCLGKRLKPEALNVTIVDRSIIDFTQESISVVYDKLSAFKSASNRENSISAPFLRKFSPAWAFSNRWVWTI